MNMIKYTNRFFDNCIEYTRSKLSEDFFIINESYLMEKAPVAATISMVTIIVLGLIVSIKIDQFLPLLASVALGFSIPFFYYIGEIFLHSCDQLILNNKTKLSSAKILDINALLLMILFIFILLFGIYFSIKSSEIQYLIYSAGLLIVIAYWICLYLNPSMISTSVDELNSAGSDALSLTIIAYKMNIKLSKIIFASSLYIGGILLIVSMIELGSMKNNIQHVMFSGFKFLTGYFVIAGGLFYPFLVYITFIFFNIFIEISQSIISLRKY